MDWIVFGDDWGKHASTTQHLIQNLPVEDRVIWINSIGMRTPKLNQADIKRLFNKGITTLFHKSIKPHDNGALKSPIYVCNAHIIPWHMLLTFTIINRILFNFQIKKIMRAYNFDIPKVLSATPLAIKYIRFKYKILIYIRLDDYQNLPGVDANIVRITEPVIMQQSDAIVVTANKLLPADENLRRKCHYIPQGVDNVHFSKVPLEIPNTNVLGFFGLIEKWINFQLIEEVAKKCPDWVLEFRGPVRYCPNHIRKLTNIRFEDPVPYTDLPNVIKHWKAAWIPFEVSDMTLAVNPIKLREYLAAGFPTLCTPLPEAQPLSQHVHIISNSDEAAHALSIIERTDTVGMRKMRRNAMQKHSWASRSAELAALTTHH